MYYFRFLGAKFSTFATRSKCIYAYKPTHSSSAMPKGIAKSSHKGGKKTHPKAPPQIKCKQTEAEGCPHCDWMGSVKVICPGEPDEDACGEDARDICEKCTSSEGSRTWCDTHGEGCDTFRKH